MSGFKDHFSGHAALYRAHRPRYPDDLFHWLAEQAPGHGCAWDCATGNGQAAVALAGHFDQVIATDASATQVAQAEAAANVSYRTASAKRSGLPEHSIDLITVAQAAHWFDLPAFYQEVRRVVRPEGVLALWTYGLSTITPAVDAAVNDYYENVVGPYWPPERRLVESGYRHIAFPFTELQPPSFHMQADWTLEQLLGYLGSWSATQRYAVDSGRDPTAELSSTASARWGEASQRPVTWPLSFRIG